MIDGGAIFAADLAALAAGTGLLIRPSPDANTSPY
jgi:hypothetical protein